MKKSNAQVAEAIVKSILNDFTDRRGLRQEWDQFDDGIKDEIVKTWLLATKRILDANDTNRR